MSDHPSPGPDSQPSIPLAFELPAPLSEQVSPDDDLHVARLVLIPLPIHIDRGLYVGTGSRADELPEMALGIRCRFHFVAWELHQNRTERFARRSQSRGVQDRETFGAQPHNADKDPER